MSVFRGAEESLFEINHFWYKDGYNEASNVSPSTVSTYFVVLKVSLKCVAGKHSTVAIIDSMINNIESKYKRYEGVCKSLLVK